jgi:hypothetical protein
MSEEVSILFSWMEDQFSPLRNGSAIEMQLYFDVPSHYT